MEAPMSCLNFCVIFFVIIKNPAQKAGFCLIYSKYLLNAVHPFDYEFLNGQQD